jgi:hypothetical protein
LITVLGPGEYRMMPLSRLGEAVGDRRSPAPGPVAAHEPRSDETPPTNGDIEH